MHGTGPIIANAHMNVTMILIEFRAGSDFRARYFSLYWIDSIKS